MIRKGTYVLFLRFGEDIATEVGSLGPVSLGAGDYCYVGSAMGGLDQRLSRHLSHEKNKRWHIDYLTTICREMSAYEHEGTDLPECLLAERILSVGGVPVVLGFGCSDCHCQTHLFKVDRRRIIDELDGLGMTIFTDRRTSCNTKRC